MASICIKKKKKKVRKEEKSLDIGKMMVSCGKMSVLCYLTVSVVHQLSL